MTILKFTVNFPGRGYYGEEPAVPVEVLDADGAVLARTVAIPYDDQKATVDIPENNRVVYAVARLPSGEQQTRRVDIVGKVTEKVDFFTDYTSPNEWLYWSRPQLRINELSAATGSISDQERMLFRLWRWSNRVWQADKANFDHVHRESYAAQFDLKVPDNPCVLQLGSHRVPWRFVALPPGDVQVAIAPNMSTDPRAHPVRVVVGRGMPQEEIFLAYLEKGNFTAAREIADAPRTAEKMLSGKYDNPVSACIGAYFLLRTNKTDFLHDWPRNLFNDFQWLADGAVIYAAQVLKKPKPQVDQADIALRAVFERGLPVFRVGMVMLNECLQLLQGSSFRSKEREPWLSRVERYLVAEAHDGAALSFLGRSPESPDPIPVTGLLDKPRRQNIFRDRDIQRTQDKSARRLSESAGNAGRTPKTARRPRKPALTDGLRTLEAMGEPDPTVFYLPPLKK